MLQENREARVAPRQSSSFRLLQEALEAEERGEPPGGSGRRRMFPQDTLDPRLDMLLNEYLLSAHHGSGL